MKSRICIILMLLMLFFIANIIAHVPIYGGENNSLDNAIEVKEPTKSWAIYDEIHEPGESSYYKFSMQSNQRLRISLFVPKEGFAPGVVLMGEGFTTQGTLPAGVEVPSGYNYMVFNGKQTSTRKYEPFTPTSYYYTADVDITINRSGTYYIAVFDESSSGNVGIAIGYVETFSVTEWLQIPINAINIHIWEGQNIAIILAPLYLTVIIGVGILGFFVRKKHKIVLNVHAAIGMFAAFLFIGSGLVIFMQMIIAIASSSINTFFVITLIFGGLPIVFGIILVRTSIKIVKELSIKNRMIILILGILGLVLWCGVIIGSVLAIITSFLPNLRPLKKDKITK